ncbi:hypothetical protein KO498_13875 [Lentibacter algarum]|uniref:hypothetical protein n=1 Tax=Lentibacter algarum TaxID=576131 RepID=UPI001C09F3F0|nr:hypothetical protein [Lentibacter algarum]MBU2982902.1 hypothetical protein [Lentibacter algarum]
MIKLFAPAIVTLALALPAQAGGKFGSPPPDAHLVPKMSEVLGRAQKSLGKDIIPGVRLTAATSQGNTVVFMTRAKSQAAAEIGMNQDPNLSYQQRFVKTFGRKFCRKGAATRRFVDAGGSISIAIGLNSGKMLGGGKLTRC